MNVYKLIVEISKEIAKKGISKTKTVQGFGGSQGYAFRGIDDIYNTIAPLLAEKGLVILPRVTSCITTDRLNDKGKIVTHAVIECEYDFISSHDDSKHTVKMVGEALDNGDKACNKAMSAAYKYAAFQTFCIPTEGDNDTENSNNESVPFASEQTIAELNKLMTEAKMEKKVILTHYNVTALSMLSVNQANSAIRQLKRKLETEQSKPAATPQVDMLQM